MTPAIAPADARRGFLLGGLGVLIFAMTMPMSANSRPIVCSEKP